MRSLDFISCALGTFLCGAIVATSAVEAEEARLTALVNLKGTCRKLTVKGTDQTAVCRGVLVNSIYSDGRTGFYFAAADGFFLTFSNRGQEQIKPDANTAISPVDMVLAGYKGGVDRIRATGSCKFTDPYHGPAPVVCRAETAVGVFEGSFVSDGGKPDAKTF